MNPRKRKVQRRGSVSLFMIIILLMGALIVTGLSLTRARDHDLSVRRVETAQAFYASEGAMNMALREIIEGADEDGDGVIGGISDDDNAANDITLGAAMLRVEREASGADTLLTAVGRSGSARRTVRGTLTTP